MWANFIRLIWEIMFISHESEEKSDSKQCKCETKGRMNTTKEALNRKCTQRNAMGKGGKESQRETMQWVALQIQIFPYYQLSSTRLLRRRPRQRRSQRRRRRRRGWRTTRRPRPRASQRQPRREMRPGAVSTLSSIWRPTQSSDQINDSFFFQEKDAGRQKASDEGKESWDRRWYGDHHVVGAGGGEGGSDPSDQWESKNTCDRLKY